MTVHKLYLADLGRCVLRLGKQGENEATEFIFDVARWMTDWPGGTVTAALRTPDGVVRETKVTQQGNLVEWSITSAETALSGNGVLELSLTDESGAVVKSVSAVTAVASSITSASGELAPPISGGGERGPKGDKGDPGVGIENVTLNDDYTLTVTLTDGSEYTTGSVRGPQGERGEPGQDGKDGQPGAPGERGPEGPRGADGLQGPQGLNGEDGKDGDPGPKGDKGTSISNVSLQEDYGLKIDLDDGTSFTTASVRGEKGADGAPGSPGERGPKGEDGATGERGPAGPAGENGNGVKNVELQEDYTLKFTMDDESTFTTASVRGPKGEDGKDGEPGITGPAGPPGPTGLNGEDGADGSKIYINSVAPNQAGLSGIKDGDVYINSSTWVVYERESGIWRNKGMIAPSGGTGGGNKITCGTLSPELAGIDNPQEGDLYINTVDYNLYAYKGSSWVQQCILKGPKGDSGEPGAAGSPGQQGPAGENGKNGENGKDGTKVYVNAGDPSTTQTAANEGDLYIQTDNNYMLYERVGTSWMERGELKGPKGDAGESGGTAERLSKPRLIQTRLNSMAGAYFDGSDDIEPGVLGILQIKNGGTGASNAQDAKTALGVPQISLGIMDLTPGVSALNTGQFFFCYEPNS